MVVQMKYLKNASINDYKSYLTVNMFFFLVEILIIPIYRHIVGINICNQAIATRLKSWEIKNLKT